jgi:hypothetical protein
MSDSTNRVLVGQRLVVWPLVVQINIALFISTAGYFLSLGWLYLCLYRHSVPRIVLLFYRPCTRHYVPRTCTRIVVLSSMYSSLCSSSMYSYLIISSMYSSLRSLSMYSYLIISSMYSSLCSLSMSSYCLVHVPRTSSLYPRLMQTCAHVCVPPFWSKKISRCSWIFDENVDNPPKRTPKEGP